MRVVIPVSDLVDYFHGYPGGDCRKMLRKRIVTALVWNIPDRNKRERIADIILSKLEKGDYQVV